MGLEGGGGTKKEKMEDKIPLCESMGHRLPKKNRSPKGNMWSAIPVALLLMIVNWSEGKQGSGPEGYEVL